MGYLHGSHYSHQVIEKTIDTKDRMRSKDVKGAKSGLRQFCFVSAHGMPMTGKTRNRKMFSENVALVESFFIRVSAPFIPNTCRSTPQDHAKPNLIQPQTRAIFCNAL